MNLHLKRDSWGADALRKVSLFFFLFAIPFLVSPSSLANNDVLSEFNKQLIAAKKASSDISNCKICISKYSKTLEKKSDENEIQLGKLSKEISDTQKSIKAYEVKVSEYKKRVNEESQKLAATEQRKRDLERKKDQQKPCGWFNWLCGPVVDAATYIGLMKDYDNDIRTAKKYVNRYKNNLSDYETSLRDSRSKLTKAQQSYSSHNASKQTLEADISKSKKTVSFLTIQLGTLSQTMVSMEAALSEASDITEDTELKRRTLRKIKRIAEELSQQTSQAPKTVSQSFELLPQNGRECAK